MEKEVDKEVQKMQNEVGIPKFFHDPYHVWNRDDVLGSFLWRSDQMKRIMSLVLILVFTVCAAVCGCSSAPKPAESTPAPTASPVPEALRLKQTLFDAYGYDSTGASILSVSLLPGTMAKTEFGWAFAAIYHAPIEVPTTLQDGETVTVTVNELTGESMTLVYRDGFYYDAENRDYYFHSTDKPGVGILYTDSEDRVDKAVAQEKIYIRSDATDEVAIINESSPFSPEDANRDGTWYNGIYLDSDGYAKRLVYFGD